MLKVIKEFGGRVNSRDKEMIPGSCAGDVEKVPFGVINLLQIGVVPHGFDAFLQGEDLVIARHHGNSAEFQAFGEMHRADGNLAARRFDVFIEDL